MNHWIIAPIILPALLAPILGYVMRHDVTIARIGSIAGSVAMVAIAAGLFVTAAGGDISVYRLGDWPAPFGIVLVLDRLSALMVLLTSVLALIVLIHAVATNWDAKGVHFHALFQFQLMGIAGAFLTGDVFNLFVFFEVLLIASYGLMIHSGGRARMRAGLQYVVMNLAGSTLFLFALGTLYASTGTLNIADLAVRLQEIPVEEAGLVRVAAMLLMIVFAVKAALFPVQFWLPGAYSNAPAPVAALFAIMTKVGAYAILRIHNVVFGPDIEATGDMAGLWLFAAAIVTVAIGAMGVLGARRLMPLIAFSVLGSMGTLMLAIAAFTPGATTAALYYLVHSTFAAAALFLIADLVITRRPGDTLTTLPATVQNGLFAALFFGAAIGMAGMPPLSGFLGKLFVLENLRAPGQMAWAWSAILIGSLVTIVGFARAGSALFWKSTAFVLPENTITESEEDEEVPITHEPARAWEVAPTMAAIGALAALSIFAGPAARYLEATSDQIIDRTGYVAAVLSNPDGLKPYPKSHGDEEAGYGEDAAKAEGHTTEEAH
ncbi:monovalent cation/H+ antiporter subunit D [Maritimibacter sp. UBA3975]|uniref:monovalent cation/H+ antiporter subunit D n=1 Tax=Maritimibacter sp. UBA3975 TaxID=1946833 RepID=UPI000C0AFC1E|nr:monovalent cation/H+ antiporter subunit D [Maritimibacter sp. UBA3975]MAM62878.1 monovalent cation/H+ antiporter subunit D [Maritimibacter sp.]|tara:strand:+ start:52738 stop:54381 length:1644 start_codon:yes stop_codon:yes gene_type:complete